MTKIPPTLTATQSGIVSASILVGSLILVIGGLALGLTTVQLKQNQSQDTRSQAATSCAGFTQTVCTTTAGCTWTPPSTTTQDHGCSAADCTSGRTGCSWGTITDCKLGTCKDDPGEEAECYMYRDSNTCEGNGHDCKWQCGTKQVCQGTYTTTSTTPGSCSGTVTPVACASPNSCSYSSCSGPTATGYCPPPATCCAPVPTSSPTSTPTSTPACASPNSCSYSSCSGPTATGYCPPPATCCAPVPTSSPTSTPTSTPTSSPASASPSPSPATGNSCGSIPHLGTACYSWTECKICINGLYSSIKPDGSTVSRSDCPNTSRCYQEPTSPPNSPSPSQDPQPSTSPSTSQCYFGVSSCDLLNPKRLSATDCTNCPAGSATCCGNLLTNHCSLGNSYCDANGRMQICKKDYSGYESRGCATGYSCLPGQTSCQPTPLPSALPSTCSKSGDTCLKKGIQACTLNGQPGTQICDLTKCDDSLSCSETPTNCSRCAVSVPIRAEESANSCTHDSDCPLSYYCSDALGECLPRPTKTPPATPIVNNSPTPLSNGASCSNGLVSDGTYFCYGKSCLKCENGKNVPKSSAECAPHLNTAIGGSSCLSSATGSLNPNYCSQTDPSIRDLQKYNGCDNTFMQKGCGETVMSMIIAEKTGQPCDPVTTAQTYYNESSACDGTSTYDQIPVLQELGIEYSSLKGEVTKDKIVQYINSGWEAMMLCDVNGISHYTLARDVLGDELVFSDPYFGDGTLSNQEITINNYSECYVTLVKI